MFQVFWLPYDRKEWLYLVVVEGKLEDIGELRSAGKYFEKPVEVLNILFNNNLFLLKRVKGSFFFLHLFYLVALGTQLSNHHFSIIFWHHLNGQAERVLVSIANKGGLE